MTTARKGGRIAALAIVGALAATGVTSATASATAGHKANGHVYTLTNAAAGNAVLVFDRAADGSLTPAGSVPTGGAGSGAALGSQGAVVLERQRLYAVNPGSNSVAVFAVRPWGLEWLDTAPSGGEHPISVTVHGRLVYVLNDGGDGNVSALTVGPGGDLEPLAGSTRPLSGAGVMPAQVELTPRGDALVVTEKGTNLIDVYALGADGRATGLTSHASGGATPFGFAFGKRGTLVVSDAFGGAADASALSSYLVGPSGSFATATALAPTTETAACWVVVTKNGRYAYTTNTGSGSVSGYRVALDGTLAALDADGRTGETGAGPADAALSRNSAYLYTRDGGASALSAFAVHADGSLAKLAGNALPAGTVGLAAS